jgi:hypothetical protein
MMTLEMPTLFALLGTALMAVAVFAPRRVACSAAAAPALQVPRFVEVRHDVAEGPRRVAEMQDEIDVWPSSNARDELTGSVLFGDANAPPVPTWHLLVDPRAAACDAAARWELVDALAAVRAPWAEAILVRALDDESDPDVRNAVRAALAA